MGPTDWQEFTRSQLSSQQAGPKEGAPVTETVPGLQFLSLCTMLSFSLEFEIKPIHSSEYLIKTCVVEIFR